VPRTCEIPAVGLPYFDEQHERLIDILHELDSSVSRNMKTRIVREALLKLMNFAEVHSEESFMGSISFPGLEDHRREHGKIKSRLNAVKTDLDRGVTNNGDELLEFIYCWIEQHLANFDMEYGKFYQESKCRNPTAALSALNSQSLNLTAM
jgi:hemerythrin-like metal-binding protein